MCINYNTFLSTLLFLPLNWDGGRISNYHQAFFVGSSSNSDRNTVDVPIIVFGIFVIDSFWKYYVEPFLKSMLMDCLGLLVIGFSLRSSVIRSLWHFRIVCLYFPVPLWKLYVKMIYIYIYYIYLYYILYIYIYIYMYIYYTLYVCILYFFICQRI